MADTTKFEIHPIYGGEGTTKVFGGATTIADYPDGDTIGIICMKCDWWKDYTKSELIEKYGGNITLRQLPEISVTCTARPEPLLANGEPFTYCRAAPWSPFICDANISRDMHLVSLKFVPKSWYRRPINPKGFEENGRKALSFLFWGPVGVVLFLLSLWKPWLFYLNGFKVDSDEVASKS